MSDGAGNAPGAPRAAHPRFTADAAIAVLAIAAIITHLVMRYVLHADGVVVIHLLGGRLEVSCGGTVHRVAPGQLVALAPGESHAVHASEPSEMLLTVHRTEA